MFNYDGFKKKKNSRRTISPTQDIELLILKTYSR